MSDLDTVPAVDLEVLARDLSRAAGITPPTLVTDAPAGYSIAGPVGPGVVLLPAGWSPTARVGVLAHEVGHLARQAQEDRRPDMWDHARSVALLVAVALVGWGAVTAIMAPDWHMILGLVTAALGAVGWWAAREATDIADEVDADVLGAHLLDSATNHQGSVYVRAALEAALTETDSRWARRELHHRIAALSAAAQEVTR